MERKFITGNEALVYGAIAAGATFMSGYPITPSTEVLQTWAKLATENKDLIFLQTEDEMSAGFAVVGALLAGKKAFTATAGPGNVLLQDAVSMAENMRLPFVGFINQRGGPSTGTVIYSQQELNLTCYGGNGEGLRIVYSASSIQEMYDLAIEAFNSAWKFRFPTFVLSDGYLAKTLGEVNLNKPSNLVPSEAQFLNPKKKNGEYVNLRNTYNLETELFEVILQHKKFYDENVLAIADSEVINPDADIIIFAHGAVAASAKTALKMLEKDNIKVGLFRPITLLPFDTLKAKKVAEGKKVIVFESSLGQFERFIKQQIFGTKTDISLYARPALGIPPEEIVSEIKAIKGGK